MSAHSHEGGGIQAKFITQLFSQVAADGAGGLDLGEDLSGQFQGVNGFPVPILGGGVVELGGSCDGIFRTLCSGEEIAQQVGGQQHGVSDLQCGIALTLSAIELVKGIECQTGINAAAGIEGLRGDLGSNGINILLGAQTVGTGNAGQMTVPVQKTVIHAPGVDAEGVQFAVATLPESQQTLFQLIIKVGGIPVEYAVHLDVVVLEAVQLLHGDALAVELAQDRAAIAGAQVKG